MKVYNECKEEKPFDFALRLHDFGDGDIRLNAVDPETGKNIAGGAILTIFRDGKIKLHRGLNPKLKLGDKLLEL